ncbi:MAG: hypothetical protein JW971_05845 [Synergistales bacterium]|nr:hypothetical protein [Synergistales bacterium]
MWLLFSVVAVIAGILREKFLTPRLGPLRAHQAGTLIVTGIFFILTYWLLGNLLAHASVGEAWSLGLIWLVMTICFEFLFGHYVVGHSWGHLLADYNLLKGRLWGLVLVGITLFPRLVQLVKGS